MPHFGLWYAGKPINSEFLGRVGADLSGGRGGGKQFQFRVSVSVGAAGAAPLVFMVHCGVKTVGIGAVAGLEIGMLFHAVISGIRGEGDARGNRRRSLSRNQGAGLRFASHPSKSALRLRSGQAPGGAPRFCSRPKGCATRLSGINEIASRLSPTRASFSTPGAQSAPAAQYLCATRCHRSTAGANRSRCPSVSVATRYFGSS
jgi:hypothetical protein